MSLSLEVFHKLPEVLRHLFRLPAAQNHTFVDVVPEGVDGLLLLLAAMVRFFARVVENVLVDPATIFTLLLPLLPCSLLLFLLLTSSPLFLTYSPLFLACSLLLLCHYLLLLRCTLLLMLPLIGQLGQGFYPQLCLLEAELMRDCMEVEGGRGVFGRVDICLHCFVSDLFGGALFKAGVELFAGDAYFNIGIDGAALPGFVLAEDALGVVSAALAFAPGGEQFPAQQDLLARGRLNAEMLVGADLRKRLLKARRSTHNITLKRLLKLLTCHPSLPPPV